MIIPWLKGFLSRDQVPLTWTLILLNVFIFVMTYDVRTNSSREIFFSPKQFEMSAKLYHQFITKDGSVLPQMSDLSVLGLRALRDVNFINKADKTNFVGDQVAIQQWKQNIIVFREGLEKRQTKIFGLSFDNKKLVTWITYQFMHVGFIHLISNMLLLVIFAGALESTIGGFGLVLVYILSGFAGAIGFLILGDQTIAAMVGASGSLSGIMAFYTVYEKKKRVPFFYFLTPIQGFYGWLWLPTWIIFPLFFVADVASYFGSSLIISSGVAYTAHIGGMIFGIIAGLTYRKWGSVYLQRGEASSHRIF